MVARGMEAIGSSRGAVLARRHLAGLRLTRSQAIAAKCADCCCWYADGRSDCEVPSCPLYPYMPYNRRRERKSRELTPEQREKVSARLREAHSLRRRKAAHKAGAK